MRETRGTRFSYEVIRGDEPELAALGELVGEIGEEFGEDFAFASLRAANAGQPDPVSRRFWCGHLRLRLSPGARDLILDFVVLFEDVERVAVMQLHADRAQDGSYGPRGAALLTDNLANVWRGDAEFEDSIFFPVDGLHRDSRRLIDQGTRDFADQFVYLHHIDLGHDLAPDLLHSEIGDSEFVRNRIT
jgi:hypothetical protein